MTKLNTYSAKGVKKASINMPKNWQEKQNLPLLAQAIRVYEAGRHPGLSKVKARGEVSYSTRKIYRQKGTGQARHGDRGAPIFVKGGIAHGPKGVKRKLSLPKKMRKKALAIALRQKAEEGSLVVVGNLSTLKKTKDAAVLIKRVCKSEKDVGKDDRFTFALSEKNKKAILALRNLANVEVIPFKNLNAYNVYFAGVLVVDKEAIEESIKGIKSTKSIKGKSAGSVKKSV